MELFNKYYLVLISVLIISGCGSDKEPDGSEPEEFRIWSSAFSDGDPLPYEHTCEAKVFGEGVSPDLTWSTGPEGTKSYAIVFKDLTLVDSETPDYAYHWMMWNIPASVTSMPAELGGSQFPPEMGGAEQFNEGVDPEATYQYFGPCPSWQTLCSDLPRANDTYSFTLYAFDQEELTLPEADEEINNYIRQIDAYFASMAMAETELTATSDASPASAPLFCPEASE